MYREVGHDVIHDVGCFSFPKAEYRVSIPAVRLTCIACFSPISQSFSTDFYEILQGLF